MGWSAVAVGWPSGPVAGNSQTRGGGASPSTGGGPSACELGKRHVAVLGPLAAMHVNQHPLAIDVADLQVQPFLEPKSQRVDRPEVGTVVVRADGVDETPHLIDREHVGESLLLADAEPLECRPVAGRGVGIEELDAAVGDPERPGGELLVVLEVEEVVADLMLAEPVGWGVEVFGELPDGAEVGLLGVLR